mmetsp:Transcript_65852/g.174615  ORF Transcript_65852/g.174615 Transcript_65852/m.174615 type:complete len:215 (+) Transcript_65852:1162-1806(+)
MQRPIHYQVNCCRCHAFLRRVHDDIQQLLAMELPLRQQEITISKGVSVRHFSRCLKGIFDDIAFVLEPGIGGLYAALIVIVKFCEEVLSNCLQGWKEACEGEGDTLCVCIDRVRRSRCSKVNHPWLHLSGKHLIVKGESEGIHGPKRLILSAPHRSQKYLKGDLGRSRDPSLAVVDFVHCDRQRLRSVRLRVGEHSDALSKGKRHLELLWSRPV